jgi:tetratricopeptide (TPR) repeat protein
LGRERIRTWKYIYFCIAGLIFSLFLGCATLQEAGIARDAREHLVRGGDLLANGDYGGALKAYQAALSLSGRNAPGDEALFNMGLIYANCEYQKRHYEQALDLFKRLVKTYTESPLFVQATIWIGILEENERLSGEVAELNKTIKKTKQVDIEIEEKKKELSK